MYALRRSTTLVRGIDRTTMNFHYVGNSSPVFESSICDRFVLRIQNIVGVGARPFKSLTPSALSSTHVTTRTSLIFGVSRFSTSSSSSSSSQTPLTLVEDVSGIRLITLNNPKKRNALSLALLTELHQLLTEAGESRTVKVVVIGHEGPVFSSGHDLKELTRERGTEYHKRVFDLCSEVMKLVQDVPMPVIAKIDGLATAAGCQLVASCDIAVATENSKFATPGVNVGLFCSTPAVAVARSVPRKVAAEMLFTGDPIDAETALRHGLLSKVVSSSSSASVLDDEVHRIASRIASVSRDVTRVGKACLYRQLEMDRNQAYVLAGNTMVDNLKLDDGKEGIDAFVEKRKPVWKD